MTEVKLRIYEFKLFSKAREYHAEIEKEKRTQSPIATVMKEEKHL